MAAPGKANTWLWETWAIGLRSLVCFFCHGACQPWCHQCQRDMWSCWTAAGLLTHAAAGTNCSLVVRLQSTKNNNFSWWLLTFWWAYAASGKMCHYFCSIKKDTNKQILVHGNFWNTDISLQQETQNWGWLWFLQPSWCLVVPTKLHLEPSACSPTALLSKVMGGWERSRQLCSQPSATRTALGGPWWWKEWMRLGVSAQKILGGSLWKGISAFSHICAVTCLVEGLYRCKQNVEMFL